MRPRTTHPTKRRPRTTLRLLAALAAVLLAAAACGSDNRARSAAGVVDAAEDSMSELEFVADDDAAMAADTSAEALAEQAPSAERVVGGATGANVQSEPAAAQPGLSDLGRDIVYTATLELGATDITTTTSEIIGAVERRGGFVFSQDTRGGSAARSVIVFKVFPEQFHSVLADLGSIGSVRAQTISAEDVTAVVVDLQSRIKTADASVERLRNLLEGADDIKTIADLENQLLQRETTLEQLRGQLRSVEGRVDLATITVTVTELLNLPAMSVQATSYLGQDGGFSCFDGGQVRSVEAANAMTLCWTVTNEGDTPLVDIEFDDQKLGVDFDSLVVVDGNKARLEPGDRLIVAHEFEPTESLRLVNSLVAVALDGDDNRLAEPVHARAASLRIDVFEVDDGLPSFGDVLAGSWNLLKNMLIGIALAAVALAPFLLVALVAAPIVLWLWRRRPVSRTESATPPPPAGAPQTTEGEEAGVARTSAGAGSS